MASTDRARRAVPSLNFNGQSVKQSLAEFLEHVSYTDAACGESDSIEIRLQNIGMKWLSSWYPKKGDKISGSFVFHDWTKQGADWKLSIGTHVLDDISFSGGPLQATFGALAIPANSSFKTRERTQTWSNTTLKKIASTIATRYGLKLSYSGADVSIAKIEQSNKTDSSFIFETIEKYGLSLKVYNNQMIVFDKGTYEAKGAVLTIKREDFIDDDWEYNDTLVGVYNGANYSYKSGNDTKTGYIGLVAQNASTAMTYNCSEEASNVTEAMYIAAGAVNKSNESATTITGTVMAREKLVAGVTVNISGFGKADGKYFVDKVTTQISEQGTTQKVELHKCQKRVTVVIKQTTPAKKQVPTPQKTYKVGDVVWFKGGTHYVSSYPGARGYRVSAGPAKINIMNGSGKAHPWSLITTNWAQTHVWGWVDNGTFT